MTSVDWMATALAVATTWGLTQLVPALNSLWAIAVFFVLAGFFGGILRILRGEVKR